MRLRDLCQENVQCVQEVQKVGDFRLPMLVFSPISKEDEVLAIEDFQSFLIMLKGKIVEIL